MGHDDIIKKFDNIIKKITYSKDEKLKIHIPEFEKIKKELKEISIPQIDIDKLVKVTVPVTDAEIKKFVRKTKSNDAREFKKVNDTIDGITKKIKKRRQTQKKHKSKIEETETITKEKSEFLKDIELIEVQVLQAEQQQERDLRAYGKRVKMLITTGSISTGYTPLADMLQNIDEKKQMIITKLIEDTPKTDKEKHLKNSIYNRIVRYYAYCFIRRILERVRITGKFEDGLVNIRRLDEFLRAFVEKKIYADELLALKQKISELLQLAISRENN